MASVNGFFKDASRVNWYLFFVAKNVARRLWSAEDIFGIPLGFILLGLVVVTSLFSCWYQFTTSHLCWILPHDWCLEAKGTISVIILKPGVPPVRGLWSGISALCQIFLYVQSVLQFCFCLQQILIGINERYMYIRARGRYQRFAGYHHWHYM